MQNSDPPLRAVVAERIFYVWLDADGAECSPHHEKFHTALRFHEMYSGRASRRERAQERMRQQWGADYEAPRNQYPPPETKTGKPPVKLERRVVRTHASDLTDAQQIVLNSYLEDVAA